MTDKNDMNHAVLNLSSEEKRVFGFLFDKADVDQLGVITGERAVSFFERTGVQPQTLGEIWQLADTENRGFLSKPGFCIVLRLIGHFQAGREPSSELAFKSGPIPRFEGLQIPAAPASPSQAAFPPTALQPQNSGTAIRIPPMDPQKVAQYSTLFERSGALTNGLMNGLTAKAIFERAGLQVETLGKIWTLADREQRGALDQTEFIVAMHLLTSMKTKAMTALPNSLPQGFYDAAARRGAPPPPQARQNTIPRQFTGSSIGAPVRTASPLARGVNTPPPSAVWTISHADKAKFDQFFNNIDTQGRGLLTGEQAVTFFGDSGLPEDTLASIWDLADINSEGQLNKDEFAVAMYLIRQQRSQNPPPLPAFLPTNLIPPSMRKPGLQQQTQQTTAPAFDTPAQPQTMPKSAADDLFGLDEPTQPVQAPMAPAQKSIDPFETNAPSSPASPTRFQPQAQSTFKPFMPTSAFGASLASQNTGGSQSMPQTTRAAPSAMDDLLGDNDTNAEESSKLNNDTTELANMSNQIGNLRTQMETTQTKKSATQHDLNTTNAQKRDLEARLQQFRAQYEQEVRSVKELEQQLTLSRDSTKKLGQELALLEGAYQDLQTQHQGISQALQADQAENANLKQRTTQLNAEVARLKPEIEKLKLDARQQKGMVSINKKQVTTNEAERDRLINEKTELERAAEVERERLASEQAQLERQAETSRAAPEASSVVSPAGSTLSSTNPFFRRAGEVTSPPASSSAFDQLFGPSFANTEGAKSPAPTTSFSNKGKAAVIGAGVGLAAGAGLAESMSHDEKHTPAATPSAAETIPVAEPPPPPLSRQFTPEQLPVGRLPTRPKDDIETASTAVRPPGSRAGDSIGGSEGAFTPTAASEDRASGLPAETEEQAIDTGAVSQDREMRPADTQDHATALAATQDKAITSGATQDRAVTPAAITQELPGAFPDEQEPKTTQKTDDFDSAFANFGAADKAGEERSDDPFTSAFPAPPTTQNGFSNEFPPIRSLEHEDDDSDSDEEPASGFDDSFNAPAPQHAGSATHQSEPIATHRNATAAEPSASELPEITAQTSPPSYEQTEAALGSDPHAFPKEFTGLLPAREDAATLSPEPVASPEEIGTPKAAQKQMSFPAVTTPTSAADTATTDIFHEASSRPMSSFTDVAEGAPQSLSGVTGTAPKNAFDDFDEFDDLAEAQEADKSASDFDFGFGHSRVNSEFDSAFDSPAANTTRTTTAASGTFDHSNGFPPIATNSPFAAGASTNSSIQHTPEAKHDWDAIFSGLDNSTTGNLDTSLSSSDPWAPSSSTSSKPNGSFPAQANKSKDVGRAITPGTEHDDPILKRLTGMGYARGDALNALEMYDYDISKAVDHLSTQ